MTGDAIKKPLQVVSYLMGRRVKDLVLKREASSQMQQRSQRGRVSECPSGCDINTTNRWPRPAMYSGKPTYSVTVFMFAVSSWVESLSALHKYPTHDTQLFQIMTLSLSFCLCLCLSDYFPPLTLTPSLSFSISVCCFLTYVYICLLYTSRCV